jgi:protein disulfide-isomerase A1
MLVAFYAPWCTHWEAQFDILKRVDQAMQHGHIPIKIGLFDATRYFKKTEEYNVMVYPYYLWFAKGGDPSEYKGPRDANGMLNWLQKKSSSRP